MQNESKFRKYLISEISFAIIIIGAVLFVVRADAKMDKDIALMDQKIKIIESNHMVHIEKSMAEMSEALSKQQEKINSININIAEILGKLQ